MNDHKSCISSFKIAVCMATFQRVNVTKECLELISAAHCEKEKLQFFITDGGSEDRTVELLAQMDNVDLQVINGLYWNQSMRHSIARALDSDADLILLLNDDTLLFQKSICQLVESIDPNSNMIVVGETLDPINNQISYGRLERISKLTRIKFGVMHIGDQRPAITFNGNCVLMSRETMNLLGNLDPRYGHAFGDIDLGLRATKKKIDIYSPLVPVGFCRPNERRFLSFSRFLSFNRIRFILFDPKGFPLGEYIHFTRSHAGPFWIVNVLVRYVKLFFGIEKI